MNAVIHTAVTSDSSTVTVYSYDGNGNVTDYVTTNGTSVAHYKYGPFGSIVASSGDNADDFTHSFSTKLFETETGIIHYQLRSVIPDLGRFICRDPIEEGGGLNLYGFVGNEPVGRWDLLGFLGLMIEIDKNVFGGGVSTPQDISFKYSDGKSKTLAEIIDPLVTAMEGVSDQAFETGKRAGKVFLNGKKYEGTRLQYIATMKRELKSEKITYSPKGKADALEFLKEKVGKVATADYDEVGVGVHGSPGSGTVRFGPDQESQSTGIADVILAAMPVSKKLVIASCYRTWTEDMGLSELTKRVEGMDLLPPEGKVNVERVWADKELLSGCVSTFQTVRVGKWVGGKPIAEGDRYESAK